MIFDIKIKHSIDYNTEFLINTLHIECISKIEKFKINSPDCTRVFFELYAISGKTYRCEIQSNDDNVLKNFENVFYISIKQAFSTSNKDYCKDDNKNFVFDIIKIQNTYIKKNNINDANYLINQIKPLLTDNIDNNHNDDIE